MSLPHYSDYDGLGLAQLVAKGEVTPAELTEAAIERIERHNPTLNAVVYKGYDDARRAAAGPLPDGPFKGVPFLIKDLGVQVAGWPRTSGSRFSAHQADTADSGLVARYRQSGVVLVGKTNTPEFGITGTTESGLLGPCRNPWNPNHIAGGSSGGSASAVAAGITPLAHASDGMGSIRIPAACCGLFGLKPSRGRVPYGPGAGIGWNGLSTQHAVTISVRDSAALLDALAGPELGDSIAPPPPAGSFLEAVARAPVRLRIGLMAEAISGAALHPDCRAALMDAAALCQSLGHEVEPLSLTLDAKALGEAMGAGMAVDVATRLERRGAERGRPVSEAEVERVTWRLAARGRTVTGQAYAEARQIMDQAAAAYARQTAAFDVVLSPVLAEPPARLGRLTLSPDDIGDYARAVSAFSPYTALHNEIGVPAMSVPLAWNGEGLPIGVMFAAPFGREDLLFSLAGQLEAARPWASRLPPIVAG